MTQLNHQQALCLEIGRSIAEERFVSTHGRESQPHERQESVVALIQLGRQYLQDNAAALRPLTTLARQTELGNPASVQHAREEIERMLDGDQLWDLFGQRGGAAMQFVIRTAIHAPATLPFFLAALQSNE